MKVILITPEDIKEIRFMLRRMNLLALEVLVATAESSLWQTDRAEELARLFAAHLPLREGSTHNAIAAQRLIDAYEAILAMTGRAVWKSPDARQVRGYYNWHRGRGDIGVTPADLARLEPGQGRLVRQVKARLEHFLGPQFESELPQVDPGENEWSWLQAVAGSLASDLVTVGEC
jgi:hypothetical protein